MSEQKNPKVVDPATNRIAELSETLARTQDQLYKTKEQLEREQADRLFIARSRDSVCSERDRLVSDLTQAKERISELKATNQKILNDLDKARRDAVTLVEEKHHVENDLSELNDTLEGERQALNSIFSRLVGIFCATDTDEPRSWTNLCDRIVAKTKLLIEEKCRLENALDDERKRSSMCSGDLGGLAETLSEARRRKVVHADTARMAFTSALSYYITTKFPRGSTWFEDKPSRPLSVWWWFWANLTGVLGGVLLAQGMGWV